MRRWWLALAVALALVVAGISWYSGTWSTETIPPVSGNPPPVNPPPSSDPPPTTNDPPGCQPGQAADYFPYHLGTQAIFAGLGNEFASFTLDVVGESGGKVEWRRNNGGTVVAEVFQVAPGAVTRIYREPEVYDNAPRLNNTPNQSEVILQGPIQLGTQWTAGNATYTITSVNATVQALGNQTLTCVVEVEITSPSSLIRNYYHQQYGWVLSVFDPSGNPIESRLASFTP